jgi:hypothetical protein
VTISAFIILFQIQNGSIDWAFIETSNVSPITKLTGLIIDETGIVKTGDKRISLTKKLFVLKIFHFYRQRILKNGLRLS